MQVYLNTYTQIGDKGLGMRAGVCTHSHAPNKQRDKYLDMRTEVCVFHISKKENAKFQGLPFFNK